MMTLSRPNPFSSFVAKLVEEYKSGNVESAVMCLNGRFFDSSWFKPLWQFPICFTDHRPPFRNPYKDKHDRPTSGAVFVYLGGDDAAFERAFRPVGHITRDPLARCDDPVRRAWLRASQEEQRRAYEEARRQPSKSVRQPLLDEDSVDHGHHVQRWKLGGECGRRRRGRGQLRAERRVR
jgi:hypothetical protein